MTVTNSHPMLQRVPMSSCTYIVPRSFSQKDIFVLTRYKIFKKLIASDLKPVSKRLLWDM